MSQLSEFSKAFRDFSQRPEVETIDVLHRRAFTVYQILHQMKALKSFSLGLPFYDKPEDTLYVTFKPSLNASANDCIFLTRDDLNHIQISIDELQDRQLDEPYKSFNDRLEVIVNCALRDLNSYEKTVQWLKEIDTKPAVAQDGAKKPLLLSTCTL